MSRTMIKSALNLIIIFKHKNKLIYLFIFFRCPILTADLEAGKSWQEEIEKNSFSKKDNNKKTSKNKIIY